MPAPGTLRWMLPKPRRPVDGTQDRCGPRKDRRCAASALGRVEDKSSLVRSTRGHALRISTRAEATQETAGRDDRKDYQKPAELERASPVQPVIDDATPF